MSASALSSVFKQPRVYATNDLMVGGDKNNDDGEAVAHKRAKYIIKSPKLCKIFEHELQIVLGPRNSIEVVVFLEKKFLLKVFLNINSISLVRCSFATPFMISFHF